METANFGQKPIAKKGITTDGQKVDNKKDQEKKNITTSPDVAAVRDLILSIPIGGEPTSGHALESEAMALLSKKSKEISESGVSIDDLQALKSFYSLALDPFNEYDRATTLPKLLRKWGTELKRASQRIRPSQL